MDSPIRDPGSKTENWRVVAASVQGVAHQRRGLPCQDACCQSILPDGVLVAAVADGAGSAMYAEIGAALAAKVGVEVLAAQYAVDLREPPPAPVLAQEGAGGGSDTVRELLVAAMAAARDAIAAEAAGLGTAPRELATTLILLLATRSWVAVAQVGDGAAVAAGTDGSISALTVPPNVEYANETVFLTSPHAVETAQIVLRQEPVARIALFTDGLQRLALRLPEGTPHAPFFAPLLRFAAEATDGVAAHEQLTAFLTSPRLTERADDDLTLLLASLEFTE